MLVTFHHVSFRCLLPYLPSLLPRLFVMTTDPDEVDRSH